MNLITPKSGMFAEIVPEAYDVYGKKTQSLKFRKRKRRRIFHPTFPMKRFVLRPLSVTCETLDDVWEFLETCTYVSDQEQFNQRDYWLPPDEFEKTRQGDCEDFALWTWRQMMALGYRARFVVGGIREGYDVNGHAWVTIEKEGKHYLVEPLSDRRFAPISRLETLNYLPETSVEWDRKTILYFSHEPRAYRPPFLKRCAWTLEGKFRVFYALLPMSLLLIPLLPIMLLFWLIPRRIRRKIAERYTARMREELDSQESP
jgi:hypothetical protein